MSVSWNPWHGCRKLSEGCRHCYVYRQDAQHDKDSREVRRTAAFNLPVRRTRDGVPLTCIKRLPRFGDMFLERPVIGTQNPYQEAAAAGGIELAKLVEAVLVQHRGWRGFGWR